MTSYPPPIDKLLTLGDASGMIPWPDYLALGLGPEHIPDLVRMATDDELNNAGQESLEVWAPMHAWRALGQLRTESAAEPLTNLLHWVDDNHDHWIGEELPKVYGMLGPTAIPVLATYLADSSNGLYARLAAVQGLVEIGMRQPASRANCIAAITTQLERFAENSPTLNAFIISFMLDLQAVEAAPVMERAFAAGRVELPEVGDWEDVQIKLGLRQTRATPRPNYAALMLGSDAAAKLADLARRIQVVEPQFKPRRKAQKRDKRRPQEPRSKRKRG